MSAPAPPLVLDLTRLIPGPLAARLLADLGYRVIRLVSPAGDRLAQVSPATYAWLNAGKTEHTLDLKTPAGRQRLTRWARLAAVLLETNRPGVMERLGVGPEVLRAANPRLTYIRLAGYADASFRQAPGHDLTYLAAAGLLERFEPAWRHLQLADGSGAYWAVIAAQQGMLAGGGFYEVSLEDAPRALAYPAVAGLDGSRLCYAVYPARQGRVSLAALEPQLWSRFVRALGHDEWSGQAFSPAADTNPVWQALCRILQGRTADQWEGWAQAETLPLRAVRVGARSGSLVPWRRPAGAPSPARLRPV